MNMTPTELQMTIGMIVAVLCFWAACIRIIILQRELARHKEANEYARGFAKHLHDKHFPHATEWRVSDDPLTVITQIDNMTCHPLQFVVGSPEWEGEVERALREVDKPTTRV